VLTREEIEEREEKTLAPYAMKSKYSRGRQHPEPEHPFRTVYQRDRDRIIHSTAFRRLEYKTQVFVNHEGDHFRTRLTHTMEVAQIARTIARALNVNEDLVEAVALAHDIGHTPFGHSGEEALRELMKDHGGFEHNLHGLRVVDLLEKRYPNFRGINLTYEVRESIVKHSTSYDRPFTEEFGPEPPLIEAQIVEVADAVAYDSHDLDDGFSAGMITEQDLLRLGIGRLAAEKIKNKSLDPKLRRAQAIVFIINYEVTDIIAHAEKMIKESGVKSPEDVRKVGMRLVDFSPEVKQLKEELEAFLQERVYRHFRVMRMMNKAKHFVKCLFNAYVSDPRQLPFEYQKWVEKVGLHRGVCDYIAGMTDRFAQDDYIKLFHPYERV